MGAKKKRTYVLYVCATQEQADDHVGNIAALLESPEIESFYPDLASRAVGKFGNIRGWRRNRLRTASGLIVDAMGLDSAARGAKIENQRPDLIIFDDVDSETDSAEAVKKKIASITKKIIPAGSDDVAVLFVQNLIHPDSIASQLVDGRAEFLGDRIINGPIPAVYGLEYTRLDVPEDLGDGTTRLYLVTAGRASWAGQDMVRVQEIVDDVGITAFLSEYQHNVEPPPGGMFSHLEWIRCEHSKIPRLVRSVVWVDPAVTDTKDSDSMGIQADALGVDGKVYRLWSWEQRTSPTDALKRAIRKALEIGADTVGVETDQGGDTWESVYEVACQEVRREDDYRGQFPQFADEKAGAGHGPKTHRASKMLVYYETGRFVHVIGTHQALEKALYRFPKTKPLDLADAAYWSSFDLLGEPTTVSNYTDNRQSGRR